MANLPTYSPFFACIYDEKEPVGQLGRGTHYSIFRTAVWLDVDCSPLIEAQIHDFAVIWDEDHDIRVIKAIERIYMAGLLSPVQFIGERKGVLTVILAARYYFGQFNGGPQNYRTKINEILLSLDDPWPVELGCFDKNYNSSQTIDAREIISETENRVITYLRNIDSLWALGTKPYKPDPRDC